MIIARKLISHHHCSEAQLFFKIFVVKANGLKLNVFRSIGGQKFWMLWDAQNHREWSTGRCGICAEITEPHFQSGGLGRNLESSVGLDVFQIVFSQSRYNHFVLS